MGSELQKPAKKGLRVDHALSLDSQGQKNVQMLGGNQLRQALKVHSISRENTRKQNVLLIFVRAGKKSVVRSSASGAAL